MTRVVLLVISIVVVLALVFIVSSQSVSVVAISPEEALDNAVSKFGKSPFGVEYKKVIPGNNVDNSFAMEGFDGQYGYIRNVEISKYGQVRGPIGYSMGKRFFKCVDVSTGPCIETVGTPRPAPADIPLVQRGGSNYTVSGWVWIISGEPHSQLSVEPGVEIKSIAGRVCDLITIKSIYSWDNQSEIHYQKECIDRELGISLYRSPVPEDGSYIEATRVNTYGIASMWDQSFRVNEQAFNDYYGV